MSFSSALLVSVSLGLFQVRRANPPHNLEAGGSENPARGVASKIHRPAPKNRCKSTMVEIFTTPPRPTKPLPKKKRGSPAFSPFFATKKIRGNNLPLQPPNHSPWNPSLPLVQIWSPAPRAWYVLCCKPQKMPLWTLQNGQSRPPKPKTHLKQWSLFDITYIFALSHILDRCLYMFSLLVQNVANTCTVQSFSQP